MNSILVYLSSIIPYVILILPIYLFFRLNYIKNKKQGKYNIYNEIALALLVVSITGIISQTVIPEFEYINGKVSFATTLDRYNFIPFKIFYETYIEVTRYSNTSYFIISLLGNIAIFVPLGILLPICSKKYQKMKNTVAFGCIFSILIEVTQLLLPRATDIDDVILNTFGTFLGYLVFLLIKSVLPEFFEKFKQITILDLIKQENINGKNYALVTGASSGIGYNMCIKLSKLGFNVIAVARNKDNLIKLKKECKKNIEIISLDLSIEENVFDLYKKVKEKNIKVLINNAGFGIYGEFLNTDLYNEINMINLNIKCVHILTKLLLKDMVKKDIGYILNVSSSAAFMPAGPLMSTYYATKSYVLNLTNSIYGELKNMKSSVNISSLCIGPTKTNFNKRADIKASQRELDADFVTQIALECLFKKKRVIIPGISNKILKVLVRILPDKLLIYINLLNQGKKSKIVK